MLGICGAQSMPPASGRTAPELEAPDETQMKRKLKALSQRYQAALRQHLLQGPRASQQPALALGRHATALDLETLDVARMHEAALATMEASRGRAALLKQAGMFFAEAITPIEQTHQAALKSDVRLRQLRQTLSQRTLDLAASTQSLKDALE